MDVFEAISKRFSVRNYLDKPVEEEKLEKVLEAGRLAPSGSNRQPWVFIVVRDQARRKALAAAAMGQAFVAQAPVVIAACGTDPDRMMSCEVHDYAVNVSIAVDHMMLQAVEEGLGSCWIGAFNQNEARNVLGVPQDVKIVALFPLGYPAHAAPDFKPRKGLGEIVMHEQWTG